MARPSRQPASPLTLYGYENSAACRLVRERLCELELPYLLCNVARGGTARERHLAELGSGRVPVLVDPNSARALHEAPEILDYLEHSYALSASR